MFGKTHLPTIPSDGFKAPSSVSQSPTPQAIPADAGQVFKADTLSIPSACSTFAPSSSFDFRSSSAFAHFRSPSFAASVHVSPGSFAFISFKNHSVKNVASSSIIQSSHEPVLAMDRNKRTDEVFYKVKKTEFQKQNFTFRCHKLSK